MPHDGDRIVDLAERRARRIDLPEEPLIKMMRIKTDRQRPV
jgi:hypothetical protein